MSWLALVRYMPAVLGIVAALWYRGESLHAWGVAENAQQSNQLLTSDNASLAGALDQLEQQQRDNAKAYQQAITETATRGAEVEALWLHQAKAASDLRQQLESLRAQSKAEPNECKPTTPSYQAWADSAVPIDVITLLRRHAERSDRAGIAGDNGKAGPPETR